MKPFTNIDLLFLSTFLLEYKTMILFQLYCPVTRKNYDVVLSTFKMSFFAGISYGVIIIKKG